MKKPIVWTLILLLLILVTFVPAVTADQGNSKVETANNAEAFPRELPEMDMTGLYTDIELIEVDPELTNATENWIVLAHDDIGKKALIEDIDRSSLSDPEKIDMKKSVRTLWNTYPTKFEAAGEKSIDITVQSDGSNRTILIPIGHVTRISFDKEKIRDVAKDSNNARLMKAVQKVDESTIVLSETENTTVKNITGLRANKIKATPVKNNNPSSGGSLQDSSRRGNLFSSGLSSSTFTSDSGFSSSAGKESGDSGTGLVAWGGFYIPPVNPGDPPVEAIGHNSFIYWACKKMGYPLTDIAANAAKDPDTWTPANPPRIRPGSYLNAQMFLASIAGDLIPYYQEVVHMRQDGWNPDHVVGDYDLKIGLAPYFAEDYAKISHDKYALNHADSDAAVTLGWASHFFSDMANPMHTGKEVEQAWDKLKTPYSTHDEYESYFYDYSAARLPNVNDAGYRYTYNDLIKNENIKYRVTSPEVAVKNIATFSHSYLNTLYYKVQNLPPSQSGTGFEGDPTVQRITDNCVKVAARYTAGLVEYTMKSSDNNTVAEIPVADFTAAPNPVCARDYIVLFNDKTHLTYKNSSDPMHLRWEFGDTKINDGSFSPTNTYTQQGKYTAKLITWNSIKSTEKTMDIIVGMCPPSADFAVFYPQDYAIALSDQSSYTPTSWRWEFGDGSVSTERNPFHRYDYVVKQYDVKLIASNEFGSGTRTQTILPSYQVPRAKFTASPTSGSAPLIVQFTDSSVNSPTSWLWDFGDGNTSSLRNPPHTYVRVGRYNVSLTVYKNGTVSNTTTGLYYVNVTHPSPLASFTAAPHTGTAPLTVRFTDTSTANPTGWGWTFGDNSTINSTMQHPVHTYTANGTYTVSLWVTGAGGTNTTTRVNSICVGDCRDKVGIYRDGAWYLDNNGNRIYGAGDQNFAFGGAGWTPVIGDWASDGKSKGGVYKDGNWYLDYNGNGIWDAGDRNYGFGGANWTAVTGDWNGAGSDKIGAYKDGAWYLDYDGSGTWTASDKNFAFGGAGWTPVVGKWTSGGKSRVGVYKDGVYYIDYSGDWAFGAGDKTVTYGATGSTAVIGDWNADGLTEVGTLTGNLWKLDYDGSGAINASTKSYTFGAAGWNPVIGDWNGDGKDKIGIYQDGAWYLDYNGNGVWEGGTDKNYAFGSPGWLPVIGFW